jgi:DNA-binding MarR family transcriptional regulator/GNAT superfamily N-acetyltransferase
MRVEDIARVRAFNRLVAERVGALDETYLGRGRPLAETRLLWEIGPGGADVRELRRRLAIDSGYASRMLRSLESRRLISVRQDSRDRRVRRAVLTEAGLAEYAVLDRMSDELVRSILRPLDERQQRRLLTAMEEVQRLFRASMITIEETDAAGADARWCIEQYFAELNARFDGGFNPTRANRADPADLTPPNGLFLLARFRGEPLGCGGLKFHGDAPAEIKRMWVAPGSRGLGLGRRMLGELERRAAAAGAPAVQLETNRALTEAISLYRTAGYRQVEPFNAEPYGDHWFEKTLP